MILISEIIRALESEAPFSLQESYDNSGIQIGEANRSVSKGLICFDVTEEILDQAIIQHCDVIFSHHPLIFSGIKRFTGETYTERIVSKAIKNEIAVISVHTNLDSVANGVNSRFASMLGLNDIQILEPAKGKLKKLVTFCPSDYAEKVREAIFDAGGGVIGKYDRCSFNIEGFGTFRGGEQANPFVGEKGVVHYENETRIETVFPAWRQKAVIHSLLEAHPYEEVAYDVYNLENVHPLIGMGMVGHMPQPLGTSDFLAMLKEKLNIPIIKHSKAPEKLISKVALCGGSGSFLREKAMAVGAEAFVTADVKYHEFFDGENKMMICDVGHYESEQFTKELLYDILTKKFTNFALLISDLDTNPVLYF